MESFFKNKVVMITGHTGFKGSWLSAWMKILGAKIIGVSDGEVSIPSHYSLFRDLFFDDKLIDIRDSKKVYEIIDEAKPDYLFHLAAQPIVLESYKSPLETFNVNTMGTGNILDALRRLNNNCVAVMITSDKCYDNVEWTYGYREIDNLGGDDPYSGSKAAAEMIIRSFTKSFFNSKESNVKIAVGRAGNVIGGGDWALHRIIPDCVNAWDKKEKVQIRNLDATRPWQHVLEPLSGYLRLAMKLRQGSDLNGQAFNFGPDSSQNHSVKDLVNELKKHWLGFQWEEAEMKSGMKKEAGLLKLNCDKALHKLSWKSVLNFEETAIWTGRWYKTYYEKGKEEAISLSKKQIFDYMRLMSKRNNLFYE